MKGWVIDSSVGFSWVHPDQATPETDGLLEERGSAVPIVVPTLWFIEMANGLLMLQRRKKLTGSQRKRAMQSLSELGLTVDSEAERFAFGKISDLAEKNGLTVYDATYLEVAIRRKLSLATRDTALRQAALKAGLNVLGSH